ncbi:uncharacterized protein LOC109842961 isoform X2 [Asparagus officinalis]|uniref:uncharacterized protein LOC109842961 isoform X2 n=1 Tax=Asparagus officinalis TaxID=4686 RepID=UPI00098E7068|nr:uncharacterized protein LOC109842961 isoform X2 [Asparagus officinalis]
MERLHRIFSGAGGMGHPPTDSPLLDSSEQVYISSLALLKMLKHGRAGVPMEVMGLMLGEFVDEYTVRVVDVFAMPQSGTGVSAEAVDHVFQTNMLDMLKQTGRTTTESPLKPAAAAESPLKEKEKDPALEFKERQRAFNSQEVERRIAAIRAIQVAEVQSLLSRLRLIRSYISKEQLETPALQFFQENLPNISPVINEKAKIIELKWRITENDGGIMPDSVDVSRTLQLGGYIPHSVRSVKSSYLNIANLQIPNFVLDDPLEDQMQGIRDSFQTPGETSNRLSFGMTPKTSRQPKKGEMLMSIRGSPLGVYKEENLEAIHESGDASHGGSSQ